MIDQPFDFGCLRGHQDVHSRKTQETTELGFCCNTIHKVGPPMNGLETIGKYGFNQDKVALMEFITGTSYWGL